MDYAALEHAHRRTTSRASSWLSDLGRTLALRIARRERLDLEGMPDRVKRDLGFIDGRDPRYDVDLWR